MIARPFLFWRCLLDRQTCIHYFTAGDDIYPFKCDRLYSRLSYPDMDGTEADKKVAIELFRYLKQLDNSKVGQHDNLILVIDEAVALSDYLNQDQKQWLIRFLMGRTLKKGLQIFIVLHGQNLTSWLGTGNTGGFSATFKSGAIFVGCEATTKRISPLKSIAVATGRYFIASPEQFNKPIEGGEVGIIPQWLKREINPGTGQPDPVRSLIRFFPELNSESTIVDSQPIVESQVTEVEPTVTEVMIEKVETDQSACTSFQELVEAIYTSFKGKERTRIKRIPSGCNRVRTALKQFDESKHEGILVLLVEKLIKDGRAKLPDNSDLEIKVRTNRGSLEVTEEFEIV